MTDDDKYKWIEDHLLDNYRNNLAFADVQQFIADARAAREYRQEAAEAQRRFLLLRKAARDYYRGFGELDTQGGQV
jgi:hypothetical protein